MRRADGHVDRADLVLALHDEQGVVALLPLEEDALVRRRRDGVVGLERAAGLELGDGVDLVALRQDPCRGFLAGLERVGEVLRALVLLHVLERELRGAHVELADLGALALELRADDLGDEVEGVLAERERRAETDCVLHDFVSARLFAFADFLERLLDDLHERHRVEAKVRSIRRGGVESDLVVEDDAAAVVDLGEMAVMRRPAAMVAVAGEGLQIECNEDVGLVLI